MTNNFPCFILQPQSKKTALDFLVWQLIILNIILLKVILERKDFLIRKKYNPDLSVNGRPGLRPPTLINWITSYRINVDRAYLTYTWSRKVWTIYIVAINCLHILSLALVILILPHRLQCSLRGQLRLVIFIWPHISYRTLCECCVFIRDFPATTADSIYSVISILSQSSCWTCEIVNPTQPLSTGLIPNCGYACCIITLDNKEL